MIRSFTLAPHLSEASRGRALISEIASEAGFPEERVFDIRVACSEAIANAIEHAPVRGEVNVRTALHPDRLEVEVQGPGEFQAPDRLNKRETRGLGLPLMAKLADHVALFSGPKGGTFVGLTFYLPGRSHGDEGPVPPSIRELLEENELTAAITQAAPVGLYVLDPELHFRWTNPAYREFLEEPYRSRSLEGVFIGDAVPGSKEGSLDILRTVSRTGGPAFFPEYEYVGFARGTTYWRWEILPLRQERADPPFDVLVVISEVTEQVVARRTVETTAGQLRAVIDNMTEGVIIADADANVLSMNAEALRLHSMSAEQEARRNLKDFLEFDVRDLGGNRLPLDDYPLARVTRGETIRGQEHLVRNLETGRESVWSFGGSPVRDERGRVVLTVLTIGDVTQRKQAEQQLRESEEKFRALFDSLDQGFFVIDVIFDENDRPVDLYYLEANAAATKILGRDWSGKRLSEIGEGYEEYWFQIFGQVALTGKSVREQRYSAPEDKWWDFYVFKLGGPDSRRIGNTFLDITERKRAEEAYRTRLDGGRDPGRTGVHQRDSQ